MLLTLCYVTLYMLHFAMSCYIMLLYVMLCQLRYIILRYVTLDHVMLHILVSVARMNKLIFSKTLTIKYMNEETDEKLK